MDLNPHSDLSYNAQIEVAWIAWWFRQYHWAQVEFYERHRLVETWQENPHGPAGT
jgi:hypothetical protein